jgi:hypothetical protein
MEIKGVDIKKLKALLIDDIRAFREITPQFGATDCVEFDYCYSEACKLIRSKSIINNLLRKLNEEGFIKELRFTHFQHIVESSAASHVTLYLTKEFDILAENFAIEQISDKPLDGIKMEVYLYFEGETLCENFGGRITKIKDFQKDCKNTAVIQLLVEHPNVRFTREDLNKNIEWLKIGPGEKIDALIYNAFANIPSQREIINLYFKCGTDYAICKSLLCYPKPTKVDDSTCSNA